MISSQLSESKFRVRHYATSEVEFTQDELEFLKAMEDFKKTTGRRFPTWLEAMSVLLGLGYSKHILVDEPVVATVAGNVPMPALLSLLSIEESLND